MKSFKTFAAGLLALGLVGAASAQTVIRITGSTAYRNATEAAIEASLNSGYAYGVLGGGNPIGAADCIFSGTLTSNSHQVIVICAFTGSEGGIYQVATSTNPGNAKYISSSEAANINSSGTYVPTSYDTTSYGDLTMADTFQGSSLYKTPTLSDTKVGIVPFVWCANPGDGSALTAINANNAKALLAGTATYALWDNTGATGTRTQPIRVIGRDEDSGTRVTTFQETGYGSTTTPAQYAAFDASTNLITSQTATVSSVAVYPANTINGVTYSAGHSGYSSGGNVAAVTANNNIASLAWVVGYISKGDANTDITTGLLRPLSYNGVQFYQGGAGSWAATESVILNGTYTFWGYEHLMSKLTGLSTDVAALKSLLVTQLTTTNVITSQGSGYLLSDATTAGIARTTDGAPVYFTH
jgi:hypothetical protein